MFYQRDGKLTYTGLQGSVDLSKVYTDEGSPEERHLMVLSVTNAVLQVRKCPFLTLCSHNRMTRTMDC